MDDINTRGLRQLRRDLENLFFDKESSDVVLKVEDQEFPVHKIVLVARSPVFTAMFNLEKVKKKGKQKNSGIPVIPDCSAGVFELFLLFLYTGNCDVISTETMFDLYFLGDKYQVESLKMACMKFMESNYTVDNFSNIFILSLQYIENALQESATKFFCENTRAILETPSWHNLLKKYTIEANELFIKAIREQFG